MQINQKVTEGGTMMLKRMLCLALSMCLLLTNVPLGFAEGELSSAAEITQEPPMEETAQPIEEVSEEPTAAPVEAVPTDAVPAESTEAPAEVAPAEPTEVPAEAIPAEPTEVPAEATPVEPTEVPAEAAPTESSEVPAEATAAEPTEVPAEATPAEPTEVPVESAPVEASAESTAVPFVAGYMELSSGTRIYASKSMNGEYVTLDQKAVVWAEEEIIAGEEKGAQILYAREQEILKGYIKHAQPVYTEEEKTAYQSGVDQQNVLKTSNGIYLMPVVLRVEETETPEPEATEILLPEETEVPTPETTPETTQEVTEEPTAEPTLEATAEPTEALAEEPTAEPTLEVAEQLTEVPIEEITAEPTLEVTEQPTEAPTEEAPVEPTLEATEQPTEAPMEETTAEPAVETTETPVEDMELVEEDTVLMLAMANSELMTIAASDFEIDESGTITKYLGAGGNVVIPDTINGVTVTKIGKSAFANTISLTSIHIPDGVIEIGESAFDGCTSLSQVNIPIGLSWSPFVSPFSNCPNLTSITIPEGKTSIPGSFANMTSLTSVTIPESLTAIFAGAFENTGLTSVRIPSNVTTIQWDAFKNCKDLLYVELPDGLRSIEREVFRGCSSLTSIKIPSSVTTIEKYAFEECEVLQNVEWSEGLLCIEEGAFLRCHSLTNVHIPDSVTDLGIDAFGVCDNLKQVYIPMNWERTLGHDTSPFANCPQLTSIIIPEGKTRIPECAFCDINLLTDIVIPESVTWIGNSAFSRTGLTSVTIPSGVTAIQEETFSNCSSLQSVKLPEGLRSIGSNAFAACDSLTSIHIPDSVTTIGAYAFGNCSNLSQVNIPINWKTIPIEWSHSPFVGCTKLTSIKFPEGMTFIVSDAFEKVESLTMVEIPKSVTWISYDAFSGTTNLSSVSLFDTVTRVDDLAFSITDSPNLFFTIYVADMESVSYIEQYAIDHSIPYTKVLYEHAGQNGKVSLTAAQSEVWTCENVVFTVTSDMLTGTVHLYAESTLFAEAELVNGTATLEYAFQKSGDRQIRAEVNGVSSDTLPLTVKSLGQLEKPVVVAELEQTYGEPLTLSWNAVEHADGYVVRAIDPNDHTFYRAIVSNDGGAIYTLEIPSDNVRIVGTYAVFVMAYGYQYDQSESEAVNVKMVFNAGEGLSITTDKDTYWTGEDIVVTVRSDSQSSGKCYVNMSDLDPFDGPIPDTNWAPGMSIWTVQLVDGVGTTHFRTYDAGEQIIWVEDENEQGKNQIPVQVQDWTCWVSPHYVIINLQSIAKLDKPVLTLNSDPVIAPDQSIDISWPEIEHATEYEIAFYRDGRFVSGFPVSGSFYGGIVRRHYDKASDLFGDPQNGTYEVRVRAYGDQYEQSDTSDPIEFVITDGTAERALTLTADPTEAWTYEPVTLTVTSDLQTGTVEFFADGRISLGTAELVNGTATLEYSFQKSGERQIHAKVNGVSSNILTLTVNSLGQLAKPVVVAEPEQTYGEPLTLSWNAVEHADGYVVRVIDQNGNSFYHAEVQGDGSPTYTFEIPSDDLRGAGTYAVFVMAYGYQYDQSESEAVNVKMVEEAPLQLSADKETVWTGEQVTFTIESEAKSGTVLLYADSSTKEFASAELVNGVATLEYAFQKSGVRQIHAEINGASSDTLTLTVKSLGQLVKPVVVAEPEQRYGEPLALSWDAVEHADGYVVRVIDQNDNSFYRAEVTNSGRATYTWKISSNELRGAGTYTVFVMAYGYQYDQSESEAVNVAMTTGLVLKANQTEIWTGETVVFTVFAANRDGMVRLYADGSFFAEAALSKGSAVIEYAFRKAGERKITAKIGDKSSEALTLTVDCVAKLAKPVITVEPIQLDGEALTFSWDAVEHADGYVVRVIDQNGDPFYHTEVPNNGKATYTWKIPSDKLRGSGAYAVFVMAYGYQYDQSESEAVNVKMVEEAPLQLSVDKEAVWTGEQVTFTIESEAKSGTVLLYADSSTKEFASGKLVNGVATLEYAFQKSGVRQIHAEVNGVFSDTLTLTVKSLGQLAKPVVVAEPEQRYGEPLALSWDAVEHADGYVVRVIDQNGDSFYRAEVPGDGSTVYAFEIPSDDLRGAGTYAVFVMAYGYQYNQSESEAASIVMAERSGLVLTANQTKVWTGETVTFTVSAANREGTVRLYADGFSFAEAVLSQGTAVIEYAFRKAGERKITAEINEELSDALTLTVDCVAKLAQPVITMEPIQLDGEPLILSWEAVEHADGYVVRAIDQNGDSFYHAEMSNNGKATYTWEIPSNELRGAGAYAVFVMAYGYQYDQSESEAATVLMLAEDGLAFVMDKYEVTTGEEVTFIVGAPTASQVQLLVDDKAYELYDLENGYVTFTRAFTRSGERQVAFRALRGEEWSEPCEAQTLLVNSAGKLDAPVVNLEASYLIGHDVPLAWSTVEHAEGYHIYVRDLDGNVLLEKENMTETSWSIPAGTFQTAGTYTVSVMAYGTGYDQSEGNGSFEIVLHLPGPVILTPEADAVLTEQSAVLTWEPVTGAESYVVTLARKTEQLDEYGQPVYEKVWTPDTVNVGQVTSYTLAELVPGEDYRVAVGAVLEGTIGWAERLFSVQRPLPHALSVAMQPELVWQGVSATFTIICDSETDQIDVYLNDQLQTTVTEWTADPANANQRIFEYTHLFAQEGEHVFHFTPVNAHGTWNDALYMNVQPVPQNGLLFVMDKSQVVTGEEVSMTILAPNATQVQLVVDGTGYDTLDLTDSRGVMTRKFTRSGERQVAFRALRNGEWSEPCEVQTLVVTSAGKLDAPVVTVEPFNLLGKDVTVSWSQVVGAESYHLYVRDANAAVIWDKDGITETTWPIPASVFVEAGSYTVSVMAVGTGYDQSEGSGTFEMASHLPGPVILTPAEGEHLTELTALLTWEPVDDAESYVVTLARKTDEVDEYGQPVYEKVWTLNDTVNVGRATAFTLEGLAYGEEYRVAVGALLEGTTGWAERRFAVNRPKPGTLMVTAEENPTWAGMDVTFTITGDVYTNTVDVYAGDTRLAVLSYSAELSDATKHVFQYPSRFDEAGEYTLNFTPVNDEGVWSDTTYYTLTVLPKGQTSSPVIQNLPQDSYVADEHYLVQWSAAQAGGGTELGGYCVILTKWVDGEWQLVPGHVYEQTGMATEYRLPDLEAGNRYQLEVYTLLAGQQEPDATLSGHAAVQFYYRVVPPFKMIDINASGEIGAPITVTWEAPVWGLNPGMKPDRYTVWWYGPGLPYNEAVQTNAMAIDLSGDATSATLDGQYTTLGGAYAGDVYALLCTGDHEEWTMASGSHAVEVMTPEVMIEHPNPSENTYLISDSLDVSGTVKGGIRYVLVRLVTNGLPVDLKAFDGSIVKYFMVPVEQNAFYVRLTPAQNMTPSEGNQTNYAVEVFGFMDAADAVIGDQIGGYADMKYCMLDIDDSEFISLYLTRDTRSYAFTDETIRLKAVANGAVSQVSFAKDGRAVGTDKEGDRNDRAQVTFYSDNFTLDTEGKHTLSARSADGKSIKKTVYAVTRIEQQTLYYNDTENPLTIHWLPYEQNNYFVDRIQVSEPLEVVVTGQYDGWYFVSVNGKVGFVQAELLSLPAEPEEEAEVWTFEIKQDNYRTSLIVKGNSELLQKESQEGYDYVLISHEEGQPGIGMPHSQPYNLLTAAKGYQREYNLLTDLLLVQGKTYEFTVAKRNPDGSLDLESVDQYLFEYTFTGDNEGILLPLEGEGYPVWKTGLTVEWVSNNGWKNNKVQVFVSYVDSQGNHVTKKIFDKNCNEEDYVGGLASNHPGVLHIPAKDLQKEIPEDVWKTQTIEATVIVTIPE